jgi:hypothetical protein
LIDSFHIKVIWGAGEAVTPDMYTANGDVQE